MVRRFVTRFGWSPDPSRSSVASSSPARGWRSGLRI